MRLIAIDPGPNYFAWVHLEDGKLICSGEHKENGQEGDVAFVDVDLIVCEGITSYGQSVGVSVYETCYMIGALRERARNGGSAFAIMPRIDVKLTLCGSTRAKNSDIRAEVVRRLGPPGTKKKPGPTYGVKGDCWQALGLALAWIQKNFSKG